MPGDPKRGIKPLWISQNEITWEAFDQFVYGLDEADHQPPPGTDAISRPTKPYMPPDRGFGHDGFAAIGISHHSATEFCKWLSARSGRHYRLPTEAEWEHACASGSTGEYSFGSDPKWLEAHAWFKANAGNRPHAVASKQPNAWGIHDMHGNVAEWCNDAQGNPIVKGGSYRDDATMLRIAARVKPDSAWNASDPQIPKSIWWLADAPFIGFRVVCESD